MQDTCCDPFGEFTLTSSNTHSNTRHVTNGFPSTTTTQIAHMNLDNDGSLALLQNGSHATKRVENGNHGSESFPIQFEDLFVMSIGKVNPRRPFHNTHQIWPIGYKSIWHDKLTGSIFVCNVLEGDDYGPIFRVNRHPCSKQSLPNASTVIHKPKCGPSDDISNCLTTESQPSHNNFINGDVIGEFMVEGRSTSSAWQMVLETLICACRLAFQDLSGVNFHCNHNRQQIYGSYGVDSLDKFGYLSGYYVDRIPDLILTTEQLEVSCMVIRRWLQMDRFGLDAEFVQELIEQIPGVDACSEYKSLDARCQNVIARTVGSGFFTVLHKYNSQPLISDSLTESCTRLSPPGTPIASNLPPYLIGDVLQAHEFCLGFYKVLGQDAPLSRRNLENELLDPSINGLKPCGSDKIEDLTSCSTITPDIGVMLSNFHMALLKVLVEDMLAKVTICDPFGTTESKSRKGRKRNMNTDINVFIKKIEPGIFPINEITWPEIARRYILVLLFLDDNYEAPDLTNREFDQAFHCLNGDGGPLCCSLTGMAAVEADAMILAEASKKIFSCMKGKIGDFMIDKDLDINESVTKTKRSDNKCPEWIKVLEPIRRQPTNVGARIRNRVFKSLEKNPPEWAKEMLLRSISKDIYKGNASGPTKKIVVSVLDKVRDETPLTKKKVKESRVVRTVSDVIIKRCRMVLRAVAAEDENKVFFGFIKPNEFDDVATFSRLLDFRTIDLRLDAGFYDDSHESFIEDVREVWENLRITYRNKPKYIDSIESISRKLEELYKQEVLTLVNKTVNYGNISNSILSPEETKKELNMMIIDTITNTLFIAPWEDGICKVCGKDENDHVLLLCDRCDAEYHTYCLDPPLQRVPKASWYCPPCISFITNQTMSREDDHDTLNSNHGPTKKKIQREFTRNGLEEIADLADAMESMEYWELGVKERVFLLQLLCDEALSSTVIQNHMSAEGSNIKNFLGRDTDGRLYWVLGRPERVYMSGPHSIGELCVTSSESSSSESSSWVCYESDAEIESLVEWLKDDYAKERELKENIIKWQMKRSYTKSYDLNDDSGEVSKLRSSVHCTNVRAELEKKFGKINRCDCLELVGPGPTRHHCFSCHSTYFINEGHQCELEGIIGKNPSEVGGSKPEGIIGKNRSPLVGSVSEILPCLKIVLLDIESALPDEAFRPSRKDPNRLRVWRAFLKSARSIYEMVQATIILEDKIKTEYLRKEWSYWSSPSTAAKISTVSGLAMQIYALDAAIFYEKPPPLPPVNLPESVTPVNSESKEETPKKSKLKDDWKSSSSTMVAMLNETPLPPLPPGDWTKLVMPGDSQSKEETPKKSKLKDNWKSSSCSTRVLMVNEKPPPPLPPGDRTESVMPGNSESKKETPKKSKLKSNWKSSGSTMVAMLDDSEPLKNFIPKNKSRKELDVFNFSD